jgi:hypothetical protein
MNPILKWGGIALLALGCGWAVFHFEAGHASAKVAAAVAQAEQQHVAAVASAAQGVVYDQQVQVQAPKIQTDSAQVAALRAQLAALRSRPVPPPPAPGTPDPQPVSPPVDLVAVVAQQDLLIKAQDVQIQDQAVQIHTLTLDRDAWKTAYDSSSKEANLRQIALEAQIAATKASRWQGRIEGFVVGLGAGYVGGKFR